MLQRKYVNLIARSIGRVNVLKQYRGVLVEEMLRWMRQDNPAMNVKSFRILSRTGELRDVQDNDTSDD